jgi:hypothetical protein
MGSKRGKAVAEVEEVNDQDVEVVGYLKAGELNAMLREIGSK